MILSYESGRMTQKKSYPGSSLSLRLEDSVSDFIHYRVQGKTTTALHLAYEYKDVGDPAVVMTSTPSGDLGSAVVSVRRIHGKLQQIRRRYGQVWVGIR